MAFLTTTELYTHIYPEVVEAIERSTTSTTQLQQAIDAALAEVASYLGNYDVAAILASTGNARNAIILLYAKDIAVWHYIQLANPNVDLELRKQRYEMATKYLDKVQRGQTTPSLPLPATEGTPNSEGFIKFGSNKKRTNHF